MIYALALLLTLLQLGDAYLTIRILSSGGRELKIVVRGSDGVTRSTSLTLAP